MRKTTQYLEYNGHSSPLNKVQDLAGLNRMPIKVWTNYMNIRSQV